MQNFIKYCIALAFLLAIGLCIYFISSEDLTAREAALLSMLLTILSILATWIVTHIYTQSQHKRAIEEVQEAHRTNLRTYALKAAEKVNNLSNQLNRLAAYLEESLEYGDNENLRENFLASQQRIESSIHIINTLKSVNDTALSDWEGVIGDELDEQREMQAEKEQEFTRLLGRLEVLSESQIDTQRYAQDSTEVLSRELESIRRDVRSIASGLGLTPVRFTKPIAKKPPKISIKNTCPECDQVIEYRQRANAKSMKAVKCKSCGIELISTYSPEKDFILQKRVILREQIVCPTCNNTIIVHLDTIPSSSLIVECGSCYKRKRRRQEFNDFGVLETLSGKVADPEYQAYRDAQPVPPREELITPVVANTYIAIEHIVLMAQALGLASCWIGAFEDATDLNRLFNLPDTLIPLIVLPVGYPDGKSPPQRPRLAREDILIEPEIKH